MTLEKLKKSNLKLWNALGFLSSFEEGFFVCSFNEMLTFKDKNILREVRKDKNISIVDLQNDLNIHSASSNFYL